MSSIEIRPVTDHAGVRQIEEVQLETWGMSELEVIPGRFLHAAQRYGACLLGAYDGGHLVGFVVGLLGTVEGLDRRVDQVAAARLQMYSAIMGVLPEYQTSGIGYRLKRAQREFALRIGVRLISWTYDPLESRNGYLNIGKLGVVCDRYWHDFHGDMGGINAGLPTDRFSVDWWVTSNRVKGRLSALRGPLGLSAFVDAGAVLVNEASRGEDNLPVPPEVFVNSTARILLVEIPADFQGMKLANMELARTWRLHTRQVFDHYFGNDYLVTDFARYQEEDGFQHSYYVLTHNDA